MVFFSGLEEDDVSNELSMIQKHQRKTCVVIHRQFIGVHMSFKCINTLAAYQSRLAVITPCSARRLPVSFQ